MFIFILLKKLLAHIVRLPLFLAMFLKDVFLYFYHREYLIFRKFGLHIWVAKFGGGKTSSMVYTAYKLCRRYKQVTVLTNIKLTNFPEHITILPLHTVDDILNAPDNCIVLIDEIGTLFNSRDFMNKNALPKILFQHLCQCRKRHMVIFGTVQRWQFLDKQLRDITATVRVCRSRFADPFTRITTVTAYDAVEYERTYQNPMIKCIPVGVDVHLQTDKLRNLYDTSELVDEMMKMEYEDDTTILANQGVGVGVGVAMEKKDRHRTQRNAKRIS